MKKDKPSTKIQGLPHFPISLMNTPPRWAKPVIQKTHEVYLMEGFMDVIAAYRAGHVNAVASMGTALTPDMLIVFVS